MAKLTRDVRERMAEMLKERLPPHWRVTQGASDGAYVEADQDGERPESDFPMEGSAVIAACNGPRTVVATAFVRVKCPPGYPEARKPLRTLSEYKGLGWLEKTVEAMAEYAAEVDPERPKRELF